MRFEWDEERRKNIQKHGFDFADVPELFSPPILVARDTGDDYGENRWRDWAGSADV